MMPHSTVSSRTASKSKVKQAGGGGVSSSIRSGAGLSMKQKSTPTVEHRTIGAALLLGGEDGHGPSGEVAQQQQDAIAGVGGGEYRAAGLGTGDDLAEINSYT
mmetsp:Transcript_12945/g.28955  ORF Transcript_12945/g.28955 Transcript_12945/m.28955 type:complete len:103 (+) Transcript_12945:121-429(+)